MGLDMYLDKMPRYNSTTPTEVSAIEEYFSWKRAKEDPKSSAKNYTLKEWCGINFEDVPSKKIRDFYEPHFKIRYYRWDTEHKYGYGSITQQVGYWRKANAIHNWFVNNVQDGIDDCSYHKEVTKEVLEELREICKKVLCSCQMESGKIENGISYINGSWETIYEDGQYIVNPSVAQELLPSCSGFFFGSTDYNEYYVENIKTTIEIIDKALKETDFDKEMIYYVSSW